MGEDCARVDAFQSRAARASSTISPVRTSDFDYELPESAIAQEAVEPRDAARLLVHRIASDATEHRHVRDLPSILRAGDLLVVNDTRVRPSRLFGTRTSGGRVELLVLGPVTRTSSAGAASARWRAFVKPAKRIKVGETIELEGGALHARAIERSLDGEGEAGAEWIFELTDVRRPGRRIEESLEESGRMPLPPYIRREREADPHTASDRERYQTVFAAHSGAIAAPTAGLHFTRALLDALVGQGIEIASVTLHVGVGTFQPVQVEDLAHHAMHAEDYVLPASTVAAIERTRARGGRVIAVGTTSARVLESCADESGRVAASAGETRLFITPGRKFRVIDALLTNFHLPKSTLLVLVSALAGRERTLRLYREALASGYRFYSYGDAMLLLADHSAS